MKTKPKFEENMTRDLILLRMSFEGGLDAVRYAAMMMPEFAGGPDVLDAYMKWMSHPKRRAYRERVAKEAFTSH